MRGLFVCGAIPNYELECHQTALCKAFLRRVDSVERALHLQDVREVQDQREVQEEVAVLVCVIELNKFIGTFVSHMHDGRQRGEEVRRP